jgi:hypothetical protein
MSRDWLMDRLTEAEAHVKQAERRLAFQGASWND